MGNESKDTRTKQFIMVALAFLGAIVLISYGLIWNKYQSEQVAQNDINFQINKVWPLVQVGMSDVSDDQEERLEAAQTDLEKQKNAFPTMLGATELMETLLQIANEHHVSLSLQTSQQPADFGDGRYYILTSSVSTSGKLSDLLAFIQHLEDEPIETLKILQQVNFSGSGDSWTAGFSITIYSQQNPQSIDTDQLEFEET
ncbi:MAG: hypothetical protein HQ553_08315 [Chloroflexi bacterium]|nr:hypothetical protein [Chloroflexota bacterium]